MLLCEIFRFRTYPASDLFSTRNCRIKRHGCACAAKYCLETANGLLLSSQQAFYPSFGFCFVPRPVRHMWVISQFSTSKVATWPQAKSNKQHCLKLPWQSLWPHAGRGTVCGITLPLRCASTHRPGVRNSACSAQPLLWLLLLLLVPGI